MRVFLAGATGVIGRSLVPQLLAAGHEVIGMTRSASRAERLRASGAGAVVCDALDPAALGAALHEAGPDAVIHELTELPVRLDPRRLGTQLAATNRLRSEGTRNLVAAAQAAGARRLIAESIAFVYKPTGSWVKDESAPLAFTARAPMDAMVGAVAELEATVLRAGGIVLRYGWCYGPGTHFARDGFYARFARWRGLPILGSGTGVWSFIHVDDAAAATVAALDHGESGVYNVVDDEPATAREWIPVFARSVGAGRPLRLPALVGRLGGGKAAVGPMTTQRGASNTKARRELGWAPAHPSWRDGFFAAAGG